MCYYFSMTEKDWRSDACVTIKYYICAVSGTCRFQCIFFEMLRCSTHTIDDTFNGCGNKEANVPGRLEEVQLSN